MKSMVVLFALASVACASWAPQWGHHTVLDAHGRPLEPASVVHARAQHLQHKALEGHHGWAGHGWAGDHGWAGNHGWAGAHGWAGDHGWAGNWGGYGHGLYKRSLGYAHHVPAAVSHQSRVDVITDHGHHAPLWTHAAAVAHPISHHHVAVAPLAHHGWNNWGHHW